MSYLFWLSTLIPGFAAIQRWFPHDLRRGFVATLAWSFVLTVALIMPVVVIAYVFNLPVSVFAAFYLVLILLSVVSIVQCGRWSMIRRSLRSLYWGEVAIVVLAIAVSVPFGGSAMTDSFEHAAKIRSIRDSGFSLQDPYSPLQIIETRHHINAEHALHALGSWFSGVEPLELWYESAWFFRLVGVAGVGFLAAAVFRSRWISAITMLAVLGDALTNQSIVFPWSVAAYVVFPVLLTHIIDLLEKPNAKNFAKVVIGSLGIAVIHIGYWLVVAMCLVPFIGVWILWKFAGRRVFAGVLLGVALLPGLPLLAITASHPNNIPIQEGDTHSWMLRTLNLGGWTLTILDPIQYIWILPTLGATALLLAVRKQSRTKQIIIAGVFLVPSIYMFTPVLFDVITGFIPYWLVRRARLIGEVIAYVNLIGGLAWLVRPVLQNRFVRFAFAVTIFCATLFAFRTSIKYYMEDYREHMAWLQRVRDLKETVGPVLPGRALVAANPELSIILPAAHLSAVMSPPLFNSNPADGAVIERRKDADELLAEVTSAERRRELIAKNRIDFILLEDDAESIVGQLNEVSQLVAEGHGFRLFKVTGH